MKVFLLLFSIAAAWVSTTTSALACSCLPPDLGRSYNQADDVIHARVVGRTVAPRGQARFIVVLREDAFKGCLTAGQTVIVSTAADSAACGLPLQPGQEYLLHGTRLPSLWRPLISVGLCGANKRWSDVTAGDHDFLSTRFNCCGDKCACTNGEPVVNCFVDPCDVSSCNVEGAQCHSNYCGGCNAEWYDTTGTRVCNERSCNYEDPARKWIAKDPETCKVVRFACEAGTQPFFNECGCGCEAAKSDCKVAGCSGQLCVGPNDPGFSTCEWREEYACYREATCERQSSGTCGWTMTPELQECLGGK